MLRKIPRAASATRAQPLKIANRGRLGAGQLVRIEVKSRKAASQQTGSAVAMARERAQIGGRQAEVLRYTLDLVCATGFQLA